MDRQFEVVQGVTVNSVRMSQTATDAKYDAQKKLRETLEAAGFKIENITEPKAKLVK